MYNTVYLALAVCIQNEVAASKNEIPCNYNSNILDLSCSNLKKYVLINRDNKDGNRENKNKVVFLYLVHILYIFLSPYKTHTAKENTNLVFNNTSKGLPITTFLYTIFLRFLLNNDE